MTSPLRQQFLGFSQFRSKTLEIEIPAPPTDDGLERTQKLTVKIKQPTVEERGVIFADTKVTRNGEFSGAASFRTGALAIITCVRDPATDEPVFGMEDLDVLMKSPAGGWVDTLAGAVMELLADGAAVAKK